MSKFNPPSEFNFTSPGEWPEWKQRFARYRLATKLNKENGEVQVCSLIYAMGSEAEKIFASFEFATEDDKKNYEGVLSKLDEYFIPRRNVIHERACFYQRNQLQGEKAEAYIRVLYELAENCDFSDKRDEHIRDRLVVGIKDKELSLKLQLTADLTLAHVIQQVRQSEEVAKQISLQASGPQPEMQVASVSAGGRRKVLHKKHTPHTERESPDCVGQPLYELLKTKSEWQWGPAQESSFRRLKSALASAPVLTFYDANKPTKVSADASSYGLGGVLLQQHGEDWKPVAYCSRRLRDPETRYAQIEKECLASVWACERFEKYLIGLETFTLITDHKPLVPLMNNKDLDNVPLRCQRLLMRLMRFNAEAVYAPGKTLAVADALSRGPLEQTGDEHLEEDVTVHIGAVLSHLPATPRKLQQIRDHTIQDPELQLVKQLTQTGWSEYERRVPEGVRGFYKVRGELSVVDGSTPTTSTGFSPAELLMGRKIRTTLPTLSANLDPSWPDRKEMRSADAAAKLKQAFYYNRRNGVRHLPPLDPGEGVLMKLDNEKQWTTQGTVQGNCSTPRSYVVVTPEGGCYRRNRRHLLRLPAASKNPNPSGSPDDPLPVSSDVGSCKKSWRSTLKRTLTNHCLVKSP
uniref:Reverse transcriptase/retrotransposon-derived protein RNase H-like domain-containing protein n=1 Tax=Knipowitschia caucasica TaxID=637954 RepID=A0AAV2K977_KNICA